MQATLWRMSNPREKVLFDTDIGSDIDDALALAYLLRQPRCDLLGVTTVSGQPQPRAEMVSAMCRHAGRDDVPIHVGCSEGILLPVRQREAQQAAALGSWPRRRDFGLPTAIEFMRQTIRSHPGEVTLLAVGPLTNVAVLFATDPGIAPLLKRLVLMCGRFLGQGGEWNAINDPHATAIVYGAGPQPRPPRHVSFGLDVTTRCTMPADQCRRRFAAKALEPVRDFAEVWFARADRVTFHDPLAAAWIFAPELVRLREGVVKVSLNEPTLGWTAFEPAKTPAHEVACEVDVAAFFEHYFNILG